MTDAEVAQFPNITLAVTNVPLVMQPRRYLLQGYALNSKPSEYCLAITKTGPGGLQILGDTTLEDYYIVFDRAQKRIGWAPVNTDMCGSI